MWIFIKRSSIIITTSLLVGCGQVFELLYCDYGYSGVENNFYQTGVNLLNKCLDLDHLSLDQRAKFLQGRAWAHYNLENSNLALADQETAFQLQPPTQHFEFINHAAYLRGLKLYRESIRALRSAQEIDQLKGRPNMITQYNLGWSLYELGRLEESIEAFSTGITHQPDYPFVYLRRGLAYHKQGKRFNAKEDFSEFIFLIGDQEVKIPSALKKQLEELPPEYSDIKNL